METDSCTVYVAVEGRVSAAILPISLSTTTMDPNCKYNQKLESTINAQAVDDAFNNDDLLLWRGDTLQQRAATASRTAR
jgi:hypothetical protein